MTYKRPFLCSNCQDPLDSSLRASASGAKTVILKCPRCQFLNFLTPKDYEELVRLVEHGAELEQALEYEFRSLEGS